MTNYVVGDIQGCLTPLKKLLERVSFDPKTDCLWSVGDLINRGTSNLETLRWFYQQRRSVRVVLGNHDLHLLATRAGAGKMGKSDNFGDVLSAPDGEELMDWLQQQPLLHHEGNYVMVHAGIPPCWSTEQAIDLAGEVQCALLSERSGDFFHTMYGNEPFRWSNHLAGLSRLRVITNYFTRMRYCTPSGALDLKSKGPAPRQVTLEGELLGPWFSHSNKLSTEKRVLFGHWASLEGKTGTDQFIGLDTGCVWGRAMTIFCIETGERYNVPC